MLVYVCLMAIVACKRTSRATPTALRLGASYLGRISSSNSPFHPLPPSSLLREGFTQRTWCSSEPTSYSSTSTPSTSTVSLAFKAP